MKLKELKRLLDLRDAEELTDEEQEELSTLEAKAVVAVDEEPEEEEERKVSLAEVRSLIEKEKKNVKRVAPEMNTDVKVTRDEADSEQKFVANTLRLFHGIVTRRDGLIQESQTELARAGHYGEKVQGEVRAAGDYYSSVVDGDGAFLLPTKVRNQIDRKIGEFGAFAQISDVWAETEGTIRVPGSSGSLKASAIAEGGAISSNKRSFVAVELKPAKWAQIIPWTFEIELRQGQKVLDDVNSALAMGFANAQDDAAINGDGSGTYNSIDGLFSANRIPGNYTLPATNTSFEDISGDDIILARNQVAPEFRRNLSYVFHPDFETIFLTRKDNNGSYLFDYTTVNGVNVLKGIPVVYTQAMPSLSDDAVSTPFGLLGNFNLWKIATGGGIFADMLREGTVQDANTGADFNLATQDGKALRAKQLFDMDTNFEEGFVKLQTPAS